MSESTKQQLKTYGRTSDGSAWNLTTGDIVVEIDGCGCVSQVILSRDDLERMTESMRPSRCSDIDPDRIDCSKGRPSYLAKQGDIVWSYGKNGGGANLGHVVVRMDDCATDPRYCHEQPWGAACKHGHEVAMCECGELAGADHHWEVVPYA